MTIRVLEKSVRELIAAGEVVERPASVVKELTENAIDAGATVIEIELRRGGLELIRISDNGCGIPRDEVPTAFLRHATSKVADAADLDAIATLGFRGEALAAICAVSKVRMVTRPAGEDTAAEYRVEGGEDLGLKEAGAPEGTTIYVADLFYNVPARMKFLKKDVQEGIAAQAAAEQLALSHPEVAFKFLRDGKLIFATPGDGELYSAIFGVFPRDVAEGMIAVQPLDRRIKIAGYISTPEKARASRSLQYLFVNGRFVKSQSAAAAAAEACRNLIMQGRYPSFALNIELPCQDVDVNVHPAKIEVRFKNDREVFSAIYAAVKIAVGQYAGDFKRQITKTDVQCTNKEQVACDGPGALGNTEASGAPQEKHPSPLRGAPLFTKEGKEPEGRDAPGATWNTDASGVPWNTDAPGVPQEKHPSPLRGATLFIKEGKEQVGRDAPGAPWNTDAPGVTAKFVPTLVPRAEQASQSFAAFVPEGEATSDVLLQMTLEQAARAYEQKNRGIDIEYSVPLKAKETADDEEALREALQAGRLSDSIVILGDLFGTYIVGQLGDSAIFIDQHAAHERILFEELRLSESEGPERQTLLEPEIVSLAVAEKRALLDNATALARIGFLVEDFGEREVAAREVPAYFAGKSAAAAVTGLAARLLEHGQGLTTEETEWLLHSTACRAAIKAGHKASRGEMVQLVAAILDSEIPKFCPHGRPVYFMMDKKEMEKRVGRAQ